MDIKYKIYTIFAFIIFLFCLYFSFNLRLDASSDTLILKNDKSYEYYKYYNNIFKAKNFLILAIKSKELINNDYIKAINKIQIKIEKIKGVESTFSLVDAPILLSNNSSLSDLANQKIQKIDNSSINLDLILDEFAMSPIFKNQIINKDKNVSSIIIFLEKNIKLEKIKIEKNKDKNIKTENVDLLYKFEKDKNNKNKKLLINEIRNLIILEKNNYQYFLGGIDMISIDTINFIKNDLAKFSIAVLLFIIFILFLVYRDIKWVIIPLLTTIYSVVLMLGFIGILNWEITAISSNFVSLMLILSISMNIHIINNYRINYSNDNINNKISHTLKSMILPCFYTAITTIVAFGSLLFSEIKPIIDFGYIMIFALIFIFLTSFSILPLLINYYPKINTSANLKLNILSNFLKISIKHSKKILILNIIILLVSILGIYKLDVENSFINYFKSNTEIYKGMSLIDKELGGTTPIDVIIKFNDDNKMLDNNITNDILLNEELDLDESLEFDEDLFIESKNTINWFSEDRLSTISRIHQYLEDRDEIGKVQSIDSLIKMAELINKTKLSIFELSILYNEIPQEYKDSLIKPFLSIDQNMIKISARVKDSENIKRDKLIKDITNFIKKNFNNIEKFEVNGLLILYNNMLQSLFKSQIKSFGIILLSIFIMFVILFRSLKLSIIGIIPNIIASTFILGLIGLLSIPLDIMTITIAAITIGIAVDNTIHYIYRIMQQKKINSNVKEILNTTHLSVGYAIFTTSITIAFGFSVLILSNFIPTILFGLFTGLAMIVAMIGVLITIPAIISQFKI